MRRFHLVLVVLAALTVLSAPVQAAPSLSSQSALLGRTVTGTADVFERLGDAAENGDVDAMNALGMLFVANAKVPSDYSMAFYWFQRAVDAGSVDGMSNLATMYLRGLGVARDFANAFLWFARAADRGNAYAMFNVAVMAEHGLGTAHDTELARRMYRKAAEAGVPLAMLSLSDDLARHGGDHGLIEAHAWLDVAALAELDGDTYLVVLARREALARRLSPEQRDRAHAFAARVVADIRARAARERPPDGLSPATSHRYPSA